MYKQAQWSIKKGRKKRKTGKMDVRFEKLRTILNYYNIIASISKTKFPFTDFFQTEQIPWAKEPAIFMERCRKETKKADVYCSEKGPFCLSILINRPGICD